ncbi:MAG: hypothetical protein K6U02_01110 [Firmicutes bacterium]|nr:hypothetical protein [Bacillota bacterium]
MTLRIQNMVAALTLLFAGGWFAAAAAQCPSKTTIQDTLQNADGTPASGRVVIAWPTFRSGTCQVIAGQMTVPVTDGNLTVELFPNELASPEGTSYRVTYYLRSGRISTEYWVVPASTLPVTLAIVRSTSVPVPAVQFSMAQVTDLLPTLRRKVELPALCPAGKFLQANGAAAPPQVDCVDGTGAPLASATVSGTVKTDVSEADPVVYTRATADTLLAGKANVAHTHSAQEITTGTLPVGRGGTGATDFTTNGVLLGSGTGSLTATAAGTANQVLRVPSAGGAPAFGAINLSSPAAVAGTLPEANIDAAIARDSEITLTNLGGGAAGANSYDFSGAAATLPVKAGTTLPTTCVANKELFLKTDAAGGQKLFVCNSTGNGWDLVGDGGGGGGATTQTYTVEMVCDTPRTTTLAGNAFWTVAALAEWDWGHWEFVPDADGKIYCHGTIPETLAAAPNPAVILRISANATSGVTRLSIRSFVAGDGESINPSAASWTPAASQDVAVPATARTLKEVVFTTLPTLAARKILVVEVFHEGAHANDTLAVNTELFKVLLRVDLTQ